MSILVLADHTDDALSPATYAAVTAASRAGGELHLLVAGSNCAACAQEAARIAKVAKVLHADDPTLAHGLAEALAPLVAKLAPAYTHVFAPGTALGKNVLPRAAALLDVSQISDIVAVPAPDTFVRPIYAGAALATVQSSDSIKLVTVRSTAFEKAGTGGTACIETIPATGAASSARFVGHEAAVSTRPPLESARVVVSGGRGVGSKDNFALIEALADRLGAAVGASRAAVDSGFMPNEAQVGQTGKAVAPELYIAIGISGAIQHVAGMKDSKVIVAINKDPEAPIFQVADYGLAADLFTAVPALTSKL